MAPFSSSEWSEEPRQVIRVELSLRPNPAVTVDEIRLKVMGLITGWHGYESRGDYDELVENVRDATSLQQLIENLCRLKV